MQPYGHLAYVVPGDSETQKLIERAHTLRAQAMQGMFRAAWSWVRGLLQGSTGNVAAKV